MEYPAPPSPKQLSCELVRRELEYLYDLSLHRTPTLVDGGAENAVWHLRTDKGDWFAKVFPSCKKQFERVKEETALYAYLDLQGMQVPKVLRSRRIRPVENIRAGVNAYPVMVMKYEDLRFTSPATVQREELAKIAQTVARMHQCLKDYSCTENQTTAEKAPRDGSVTASLKEFVRRVARRCQSFKGAYQAANFMIRDEPAGYDRLAASHNACAFTPEEHTHMRSLDRQIKEFLSAYLRPSGLTESVLHGDLALEHAPFLVNGEVYLFDFSDYSRGPVAEELAAMIEHFYVAEEITFGRWEELASWLLAEYDAVSHLTPDDLGAIVPYTMRMILLGITYCCCISRELPGDVFERKVRRRYGLADHLLESPPRWPALYARRSACSA